MEHTNIPNIKAKVSRVGLGTWSMGGSLWGGTNEQEAIQAVHQALNEGINLIDTAPAYGNGVSEKIVGKAIKDYSRDQVILATKFGLNQETENVFRDCRRDSILREVETSLKRLQVDYIDLYQVHWPDPTTPLAETAAVLNDLLEQGTIKAIGVCNFNVPQMIEFQKSAPLHCLQAPFNIFEEASKDEVLGYCLQNKIAVLGYSAICRGLLSGKMSKNREFKDDDLRKGMDPKFQEPQFSQYLKCAEALKNWVKSKYDRPLLALAIRWVLDSKVNVALWGARKPEQLNDLNAIWGWKLTEADFKEINKILAENVKNPLEPHFMEPPVRQEKASTK